MAKDEGLHYEFSLDSPKPIDLSDAQSETQSESEENRLGMFAEKKKKKGLDLFKKKEPQIQESSETTDSELPEDIEKPKKEPKGGFIRLLKNKNTYIFVAVLIVGALAGGYLLTGGALFKTQFLDDPDTYERSGSYKLMQTSEDNPEAGEEFTVDIMANTNNEAVTGIDLIIQFDTEFLEVVDQDSSEDGIQIEVTPGDLQTLVNTADNSTGEIMVNAWDRKKTLQSGTDETIGTITFKTIKKGTANIDVLFENDGSYIRQSDSNMLIELDRGDYCATSLTGCQYDILGNTINMQAIIGTGTNNNANTPAPLTVRIVSPDEDNTIDEDDRLDFEGSIEGGTPPYAINWDFDSSGIPDSTKLEPGELKFTKKGDYTITLTVTDAEDISKSTSVDVTVEEEEEDDDDDDDRPVNRDSDNDGILDNEEIIAGVDGYVTNPNSADTDGDGYQDLIEIQNNYDPTIPDNISPFVDVQTSSNFFKYINQLYHKDVISGYDATHFGPKGQTSRFELIKLTLLSLDVPIESGLPQKFSDVPPGTEGYDYIHTAQKHGIIKGYQGYANPWAPVTRNEAVKIIVNTLVVQNKLTLESSSNISFIDVSQADEFAPYISTAVNNNIASGYDDNRFRGGRYILREEIAKIIAQAMKAS